MRPSNVLELTTTDPDTRQECTVALLYTTQDGRPVVDARSEPDWLHDVLAAPMVSVAIGDQTYGAVAVPSADGAIVALDRVEPEAGEGPAEVRSFADKLLEIHTWLRHQLRQVRAETDAHFAALAAGETPKPGLGLQIRQHCLAFCQSVEFHHTSEDHMFPALEGRHPHLKGAIGRLREEHRTVARLQADIAALLADIGSADPAAFAERLDRMAAELTAHLDYEEATLIPVLAEVPFPPVGPPPEA
ncbi:hemerythrin domain-containing protein [Glycomyces tarimensis]